MKFHFLIISFAIILFFSMAIFSTNSSASSYSPDQYTHPIGGGGNSSGNYNPFNLPYPSITFTPIPEPSLPTFPVDQITIGGGNVTILFWNVQTPSISFYVPNLNNLPGFLLGYAEYIFEWIAVQIANFGLALVQAFYLVFAYIEYIILDTIINISNSTGVFALPVMVLIVMAIGMIVSLVIHLAKDITIIGAG